ncbi:hypothetical protein BS78_02G190600, partial [Paspalum vaginatum]
RLVLSVPAAVHAGLLLAVLGALQRALLLLLLLFLILLPPAAALLPGRRGRPAAPLLGAGLEDSQQLPHCLRRAAPAVLDQHLAHVRRRDLRGVHPLLQPAQDRRRLLLVVVVVSLGLVAEVVLEEDLERRERAVGHEDVHVHAARPEQSRVQLLDVVGGEHEDALGAAARPEPVREVEQAGERDRGPRGPGAAVLVVDRAVDGRAQPRRRRHRRRRRRAVGEVHGAVDVLDHDDGLGRGLHQQLAQLRVAAHLRELEVVHVVAQEVGHGRDHAGLARPGRAVQQVPALPGAARALVEGAAVGEVAEVRLDGGLPRRVHGQRVERAGVLEGHGVPRQAARVHGPAARVGVEQPVLTPPLDVRRRRQDVVQVRREQLVPVPAADAEREPALLLGERPPREALPLARRHHVLPRDGRAREGVHHAVAGGQPEGEGGGVERARQAEPRARRRRRRAAEVQLHGVVDLVGAHTVHLRHVEVAVGGEGPRQPPQQTRHRRSELRREHRVQHALQERERAHQRRQRRPVLLHLPSLSLSVLGFLGRSARRGPGIGRKQGWTLEAFYKRRRRIYRRSGKI